ncbi:type IV secretion system DNA-binding domain-containing protein [Sphingomonas sp. AR_OL41]|uniref:type IV secretion system DNA-binding domain-containing protein n=1 Tax=Sphingomonas sp. AR_OL41 TaxID=3042729 RepID=UPI0024810258|nr:type IV secretion system DNA-binding domain-containing protein [Sphingomonas sp. AR_OL41]MDH7973286.1 type IV secretion system DNA-binding domain-containing protein [Sphingomonas sp. AR_OL41]
MTQPHDRRIHADALRRHFRSGQARRFKRQAAFLLASVALCGLAAPTMILDRQTLQAVGTYCQAKIKTWFASGTGADPAITISYAGANHDVSAQAVAAHPYYRWAAGATLLLMARGGWLGFAGSLSGLLLVRGAMARRRERLLRDRVIAGTRVTTERQLSKVVSAACDGRALTIGTVPIPGRFETRHMAMIGTTGSGKTTALRQLLDGIEGRGEAALVYDTSGEFVAHYYRPERGDIILNPFDARCAFWSPFAEISHPADADRIANQLITETGEHDRDVWLETSRILVANMIRALWREGNGTLADLLNALQVRTKDDLKEWLGDSSSARTFAEDADRATGSVLFMLAKAANLIQFLRADPGKDAPFAFRDFIECLDKSQERKPWIFVPRKEDYFEASKPLLACWLECAASAMLGLSPSPSRRVWFVLDELADLPRVDNLARLLPEGRKFGAAVVLTFQAVGQMRHRYGLQLAESMLGCCNTKLFLQTIDSETRQWASQTIGECEVEIPTMSDALGQADEKPVTTLGRTRRMRPAVLESELRLPKFEGYLLFPDGLPVARITLTADHIAQRGDARQPGFVAGDPRESLWEQAADAARAVPLPLSSSPPPSSATPPTSPPPPVSQGPV